MPTKIRPIVFKINEPERFVMNGSNATVTLSGNTVYASWHSPSYPEGGYNGNNKQCIIVNNNSDELHEGIPTSAMMYSNTAAGGGPNAINLSDLGVGTRTATMLSNPVPSFGAYLVIPFNGTVQQVQAYVSNLTITILDP